MSARRWAAALVLLLFLFAYALVATGAATLCHGDGATLYLPQGVTEPNALQLAEQRTTSPVAFALWRQLAGQTVAATELGRSSRVALVTISGNSAIVLPSLPLLPPDGNGCLLDSGSSYKLFGDAAPVGATVTVAECNYIITGVFDHPEPMLVLPGNAADGGGYDRVSLALAGLPNPAQAAEDFALRHGLAPYATVSNSFWSSWAAVLVQLPPLVLLGLLLWRSARLVAAHRATPVFAGLVALGTLLTAAIFWLLCGLRFTLPAALIPARWSDFEFWSATFTSLRQQLWLLLTLPRELPQAIALAAVLGGTLWCGVALLALRWLVRLRVSGGHTLFWATAGCICAAFAAAAVTGAVQPALWLMLPAYLLWGWLLGLLQTKKHLLVN